MQVGSVSVVHFVAGAVYQYSILPVAQSSDFHMRWRQSNSWLFEFVKDIVGFIIWWGYGCVVPE
jgi:hypothetical protein